MTWTGLVPGLAAMTVLVVAPGWLMLRVLGLRGLVALGAGPALTVALAAGWAVVLGALGIPWGLGTLLAGLALAVAVCAVIGHLFGTAPWVVGDRLLPRAAASRRSGREPYRSLLQPPPLARPHLVLFLAVLAVAAGLYVLAMVRGIGVPDRPSQVWDGVFHLSALETVRDHGTASSFGGLTSLYDYGFDPFYPAGYHGIVAVVPFLSVPAALNASILLTGLLLPLSLAALTRALWPDLPLATALVPLTAHAFIGLPLALVTQLGQLPYAFAHVLLPGVLALLVLAVRNLPYARAMAVPALPAGVAAVGLALVHGSTWFSLGLLAAPILVVVAVRAVLRTFRAAGRTRPAMVTAWALVGVAGLAAAPVLLTDVVASVRSFPRAGAEDYEWILTSILVDRPLRSFHDYGWGGWPTAGQLLVVAAALGGAVLVWRLRAGRWLALGLLASVMLAALAFGPADHVLRPLTGYWYTEASRILAIVVITAAPLAALGLAALARRATGGRLPEPAVPFRGLPAPAPPLPGPMPASAAPGPADGVPVSAAPAPADGAPSPDPFPAPPPTDPARTTRPAGPTLGTPAATSPAGPRRRAGASRREAVVAAALVLVVLLTTGGLRYPLKVEHAVQSFVPDHLAFRMLAGDEELDLFRRAGEMLPEGAVVIGDRFRGTPYLYSLGGVDVVYPHLAGPRSAERAYLLRHFEDIGTDPEVCEILTSLGVTHFYTNTRTPGRAPWEQMLPSGSPSLYEFRPGQGFTLVDSGGTGELYEITACGP